MNAPIRTGRVLPDLTVPRETISPRKFGRIKDDELRKRELERLYPPPQVEVV